LRDFEQFGFDPGFNSQTDAHARPADHDSTTYEHVPFTIAADVPIWLGYITSATALKASM
jgi:hypothetical protein